MTGAAATAMTGGGAALFTAAPTEFMAFAGATFMLLRAWGCIDIAFLHPFLQTGNWKKLKGGSLETRHTVGYIIRNACVDKSKQHGE
jgi:hypothetical protein